MVTTALAAASPPEPGPADPSAPPSTTARLSGRRLPPVAALRELWAQPAVRRSAPAIGLAGLIGSAALAWALMAAPPQKTLFSGLADADKAAAVEALEQSGIAHRIDPATGTLTVAEDDYYRARMLLAAQNLPKADPGGYALLDQLPMGVSRAVEGERLRQARETELARSIREIEGVTDARVHLAMPEASVFVRDSAQPSASVIVRLAAGRALADAQVRSIINLVASSVPGMKPEAVTIVDGAGTLLSKPAGAALAATDERLEFQRQVENKYRAQIAQLLTPLVGAGNFTAEVQAEVDLSETQATREAYGKQGALRAEQGQWTGNQAEPPVAAGIPGALSNTPPPASEVRAGAQPQPTAGTAPPPATPVAPAVKQTDQFARSYELDREVSVTRAAPGAIRRLSVAVVLRDPESGRPRSAQELRQLTDLVRAAVGYDAGRRDQVAVMSRRFAGPADAAGTPFWEAGWFPVVARQGTALIVALLVLLLGVRPLIRLMQRPRRAPEAALPAPVPTDPAADLARIDHAAGYEDKVRLVRDFTRENPQRAALAVRDMIRSDQKAEA
ncbi:flagellar M-ring protein FliF [Sphingomonas changnyeongensis]|uniref:Flagellar M-ring protein n=1 Tax=Sphingomonas changnyeongensis TaxID=2698679 RepID=A0A7Z2NV82_9SPHN|nr:flagellar basal-body MS-ring/collar protein FliF [Sphingomonas changnyeongensis]QHL90167.1 flagellar M-ring protein FliF [Sphingomonas changnyeongensis]